MTTLFEAVRAAIQRTVEHRGIADVDSRDLDALTYAALLRRDVRGDLSDYRREPEPPLHDTALHLIAGGFGVFAPGCPACEDPEQPQRALCSTCTSTVEDDPVSAAVRAAKVGNVAIPDAIDLIRTFLGHDPDPEGPPLKPRPRTVTEKMRGQRVDFVVYDEAEAVGMLDARYEPQDPTL